MTDGSSLESDIDAALEGRLWLLNGFSVFWLSSSSRALLRCRRKKNRPPAMAPTTATPTIAPAIIAPFGAPPDDSDAVDIGAVLV